MRQLPQKLRLWSNVMSSDSNGAPFARRSTPKDQRRSSAGIFGAIFGAICPAEGKAAGIVMPRCNSEAMSTHLEEIAFHVAPGAHAVLLLEQAGRERVAVHARQLALQPHLHIIRRCRRSLLLCLEQACRSALAHHDLGATHLGAQVLISESWYYQR
jgi:hypothetical protein